MSNQKTDTIKEMVMRSHYLDALELEDRANEPLADMERQDYINQINSLRNALEEFKEANSLLRSAMESSNERNEAQVGRLHEIISGLTDEIRSLRKEVSKQTDYNKRHNKMSFDKKSQKSSSTQDKNKSREEEKMDCDGSDKQSGNPGGSKGNASDAGIGDSKNGQESSLDMTKVKSGYMECTCFEVAIYEDEYGIRHEYYSPEKKYIWVLVNKISKQVYFLYDNAENDSRGKRPITAFLGDFKGSIQSDGYVVYKHLSRLNPENEHLLCWSHVRSKFKFAADISLDEDAKWFVEQIGHYGDLMDKALHYMLNGWDELLNYRKDGRYSIDNLIAERAIRPFTVNRKNSLFYSSEEGVSVATTFLTVIETAKMWGLEVRDYLVHVFREIMNGNKDCVTYAPEAFLT